MSQYWAKLDDGQGHLSSRSHTIGGDRNRLQGIAKQGHEGVCFRDVMKGFEPLASIANKASPAKLQELFEPQLLNFQGLRLSRDS